MYFLKRSILDSLKKEKKLIQAKKCLNFDKQKKPDKAFFEKLVEYEQQIMKKPSSQIVDQVLAMYSQCVEYFGSQQEPIKYYFVDRIQDVLKKKQTKQEEFKKKESDLPQSSVKQPQLLKPQSKLTLLPFLLDEDQTPNSVSPFSNYFNKEAYFRSKQISPLANLTIPLSISKQSSPTFLKRKVRAKMLSLQVQAQELNEIESNQKSILLDEFDAKTQDSDKFVRNALHNQMQSVQMRLAKRKQIVYRRLAMSCSQKYFEETSFIQTKKKSAQKVCHPSQNLDDIPQIISEVESKQSSMSNIGYQQYHTITTPR